MIPLFGLDGETRSTLTYNGLSLNVAVANRSPIYRVDMATPTSILDAVQEMHPTGDGSEVYGARKIAKVYKLDGVVRGDNMAQLCDRIEALAKAFDPAKASHENASSEGFLAFDFSVPTEDTTNYATGLIPSRYYARSQLCVEPAFTAYLGLAAPFRIQLLMRDPRRYLQTETTQAGAGTIDNSLADYRSWPTITITMAGAGSATYKVMNTTALSGGKSVTLDLSGCVNTDVVVIDMEHKKVTKNGVETPSLVVSGAGTTWDMEIEPVASNAISITNPTNATTALAFRRAWCF